MRLVGVKLENLNPGDVVVWVETRPYNKLYNTVLRTVREVKTDERYTSLVFFTDTDLGERRTNDLVVILVVN